MFLFFTVSPVFSRGHIFSTTQSISLVKIFQHSAAVSFFSVLLQSIFSKYSLMSLYLPLSIYLYLYIFLYIFPLSHLAALSHLGAPSRRVALSRLVALSF